MMNMKKMLALLLAVVMVVGMIPFGAMAEETEPTETTAVTEATDPTEESTEVTDSTEESTEATDPTEESTEATDPTEESTEATDPTEESTEATDPTEESTEATDPTEESTEATEPEMTAEEVETLYNAIMACASVEEVESLVGNQTEEAFYAFVMKLTEEQNAAMRAHLEALAAAEVEIGAPASSPAVNYTNAAPFGAPAVGQPAMRLMRLMGSRAAANGDRSPDNGLELRKEVSEPDEDGEYTLTLEAWATGAKTITSTSSSVPTDIILVLDQSGSMEYCMYGECSNTDANHTHAVPTYSETYTVNTNRTYYFKNNESYQRAYYCSGSDWYDCEAGWYSQAHGYGGHGGTKLTPKTSASGEGVQFYTQTNVNQSFDMRMTALKNAVSQFVDAVNEKAAGPDGDISTTTDNVDHRIAIVGFASQSAYGNNTEILTVSGTNSGSVGVAYNSLTNAHYKAALQDVSTTAGQTMVDNAIDALATEGATEVNLGVNMANNIFAQNPIPTGEKRNRVVIVFTDGTPTTHSAFNNTVANGAINGANTSKNTYNATVYSIGIFGGANGSNPASLPENNDTGSNRENRFMHLVSSNYPNATSMTTTGSVNPNLNGKSYYLSANNSETLANIFETISSEIESGGTTTTLTEDAVIKDVITEQFELPEGTNTDNIKVYTAEYVGENTFATRQAYDADVEINGKTISVSNFNYSENWVGTETKDGVVTYRGKKLIVEIPIELRDGFLGGNNVLTNGDGSGLYADGSADEPVEEFVSPSVDILIDDVTVTAPDHNVYLLGSLTADQIIPNLNVTVGDVALDMDAANFGLESWQTAYVSINDSDMAALSNLTEDTTYSVEVTVTPNSPGTATEKSDEGSGAIHVFKPYIVYQDSSIEANTLPKYEENNFVSETWKHGVDVAPDDMGQAPGLTYFYAPDGETAFSEETEVKVSISIGDIDVTEFVSFYRNACEAENGCDFVGGEVSATDESRINFIVHMKTCDLIISKTVVNQENAGDSFVFTVTGPNNFSKTVVINGSGSVTIADLPIGEYTVTEDTNWSWRYDCNTSSIKKTIAPNNNNFEFTNTFKPDSKWLNDTSYARNLFGSSAVIK